MNNLRQSTSYSDDEDDEIEQTYYPAPATSLPALPQTHSETLFHELDRIRKLGPIGRWAARRRIKAILPTVQLWGDLAQELTRAKHTLVDFAQAELRNQQARARLALLPLEFERERLALEADCAQLRRRLGAIHRGPRPRPRNELPPEFQQRRDDAFNRRRMEELYRADCEEAISRVLQGRSEEALSEEERARIQQHRDRCEQMIAQLWDAPL